MITPIKLSSKRYWDDIHRFSSISENVTMHDPEAGLFRNFNRLVRIIPNNSTANWQSICDRYIPSSPGLRLLEIGCAPGRFLLYYHDKYACDPWGIDYSQEGVTIARNSFHHRGLNVDQIIQADVFADELPDYLKGSFDIVVSHGFIEHFRDPKPVIDRHLYFLKNNGLLIVTIPNLRWFNWMRYRISTPEKLDIHNLSIMRPSIFKSLFQDLHLRTDFVGFSGTLSLRHLYPPWFPDIDSLADKLLWIILGRKALKTRLFSPTLMYIGHYSDS